MRFKKIMVAVLAVIIPVVSAIPVFAVEWTNASLQEIYDFLYHISEISRDYGYEPMPGDIHLRYTDSTESVLFEDISTANGLVEKYNNKEEVTVEELENMISKLEADVENMCVEKSELDFLISLCESEDNSRNYYSDVVWTEFTNCLADAKNIANSEASEKEIDSAYWNLRFAFNELCASNQLVGDVNGDGLIDVKDVTELSMGIADSIKLTSSQKMVSATTLNTYNLSVEDVTQLQMYLAGYDIDFKSTDLIALCKHTHSKDLNANSVFYSAMYKRYFGG